jgi:hypothetical protein
MSAELAVVTNPDEIANLPDEQRGQIITRALVESKQWLAVATKGTDPTPIAHFKAWAATVAEMTKQKGLAEDIQLDALEMVRRAERGIGLAIRNGQESGTMAKRGDIGAPGRKDCHGGAAGSSRAEDLDRPSDFFSGGGTQAETYAMTDDVPDDQFEEALAEARDEGNLSRRNVIRKIHGSPPERGDTPTRRSPVRDRVERIRSLSEQRFTSRQISSQLGITPEYTRELARRHGVEIPADRVIGKTKHIDPQRVIRETVYALEGLRQGLNLVSTEDMDEFAPEQVREWLSSLNESLRCLRHLVKELNQRV